MWALKRFVLPWWVRPAAVLAACALLWCLGYSLGHSKAEAAWKVRVMDANLKAARAQIEAQQANERATEAARVSADRRETEYSTRKGRVEAYAREAKPVPSVCPGPDARIAGELQDGAARVAAAEDRLRSLRRTASEGAR